MGIVRPGKSIFQGCDWLIQGPIDSNCNLNEEEYSKIHIEHKNRYVREIPDIKLFFCA